MENKICEVCGKEIEDGDFTYNVWSPSREDHDCVCDECAKKFLDEGFEVFSNDCNDEEVHKCWFCGELFTESELQLEGDDGDEDWICDDCVNSLVSRGEHIKLHRNY